MENPYAFAGGEQMIRQHGMTLRDYFAAQAVAGLASAADGDLDSAAIARRAYEIADALLRERLLNKESK